jgi:hypothetical protein
MDYVLRLAQHGMLQNKVIASAHLYFGLLDRLEELVSHARRILLITSKTGVLEGLRKKFPRNDFDQISLGRPRNPEVSLPDAPRFLWTIASELLKDLRGYCCLVGAGPWAEFYCSWIKQRGGVALDIGSGFDLLSGKISRPVHSAMGLDKANPYAL